MNPYDPHYYLAERIEAQRRQEPFTWTLHQEIDTSLSNTAQSFMFWSFLTAILLLLAGGAYITYRYFA
jgi:hypothetical protein